MGQFDLEASGKLLDSPRKLFAWMRANGYLSDASKGNVVLEDDQFNVVICDRRNGQPVFAIAYGEAED